MQAPRDQNYVPTLLGVDSTLFVTPTTAAVNPTTHALLVEVSVTSGTTFDVSDRAARLLGVVYGSQGAQLQQKVTSNDLIVTLDSESVAVTGTFWQTTQPVSATDLDIRDLTSVSDSVLIYGSDDGGTTKRVIKTDSGGAIQVDLEVASVAVTSFPDNEPFDVAQYGGAAVGAANGFYVRPGTSAVFQVQSNSANIATETTLSAINTKLVSGTDIGDVTINNASGGNAVNIQDGGNSITVDGTFWQATQPISAASLPLPTGAATSALQLPDGHNVTVDNSTGGAAVNIQDGGNTITVDGTVTTNETVPTTIYNGVNTVTTAGTQEALASSQAVKSVTVKALSTNTGLIYVGDSNVDNTTGFQLSAGDTISIEIANLATVYIDSAVNGEGVSYIAIS